jgi:hypothetical protein
MSLEHEDLSIAFKESGDYNDDDFLTGASRISNKMIMIIKGDINYTSK